MAGHHIELAQPAQVLSHLQTASQADRTVFTPGELSSLIGATFAELARHDRRHAPEAIRRLTLALDLRGADSTRNATLDTISLAETHLAGHDLTTHTTSASQAPPTPCTRSPSCYNLSRPSVPQDANRRRRRTGTCGISSFCGAGEPRVVRDKGDLQDDRRDGGRNAANGFVTIRVLAANR